MNGRPGVKTSEFWVGLAAVLLPYLNQQLGWNLPVEYLVASIVPAVVYIIGRILVKVFGKT